MNLNLHFQEKKVKFCSDLKVAGKELDFECPGFKLPSRKDFDEKGITALLCLSYHIFCIYPHLLEFTKMLPFSGCKFRMDARAVYFLYGMPHPKVFLKASLIYVL